MAKRVLIYRIGSLGDTLVALPALHLVQRCFPDAERRLLTNFPVKQSAPASAAILENTGLIDGYFRYSVSGRSPRKLLALWWSIASWRPDVLIYLGTVRGLAAAKRDQKFFRACGIKQIIGIPRSEGEQKNLILGDGETFEYEADRLARMVAELGDARVKEPESWSLHLTEAEHAKAEEVLSPLQGRPFLAVSMGTKVQSNEWGVGNWSELLRRVAVEYPELSVVVLGAQVDVASSEAILEGWRAESGGMALNLCARLTPRESGAVLSRAKLYMGHDSGPMHLAASVQTPCLAVFSARGKPGVWFPYGEKHRVIYHRTSCWGCALDTCTVEQKRCILSITVDEVLINLREMLGSVGV